VAEEPGGKRVSWVELYFDLIFAFAVGETTHVTATVPVSACLGFFRPAIGTSGVVVVAALWTAAIAIYTTWRTPDRLKGIRADPLARSASPD